MIFTKEQQKPVVEHCAFTCLGPPVCNEQSQHCSVKACSVSQECSYQLFSENKQFAHTCRHFWPNGPVQALPANPLLKSRGLVVCNK